MNKGKRDFGIVVLIVLSIISVVTYSEYSEANKIDVFESGGNLICDFSPWGEAEVNIINKSNFRLTTCTENGTGGTRSSSESRKYHGFNINGSCRSLTICRVEE